ncbi:Hypothetical protein Eab7_2416 [Exiguobacterium antarcticum B7]|nr:Hypothetical protein Eab7_2416 [Exiguobacterium antarcticum B7]
MSFFDEWNSRGSPLSRYLTRSLDIGYGYTLFPNGYQNN